MELKQLTAWIDIKLHNEFKIISISLNKTMSELVREVIFEYIQKKKNEISQNKT